MVVEPYPAISILRPRQFFLKIHDLLDLHEKPAVNLREVENLLDGEAGAQGVADEKMRSALGTLSLRLMTSRGRMSRSP